MKIRSTEELLTRIEEEYRWRKREIDISKSLVQKSKDEKLEFSVRAGVVILYAHWEGFIKATAHYYLVMVSQKRLKLSQMSNEFIALALRHNLKEFEATRKASLHATLLEIIIDKQDVRIPVPTEGVIKANDNLNFDTLKEILSSIGLDYKRYELKKKLIDYSLVGNRNKVAHGERADLNAELFLSLIDDIQSLMDSIKDAVLNCAQQALYLKPLMIAATEQP